MLRYVNRNSKLMIQALVNRTDYPCIKDYVYLNQASLGLIGTPAVKSMHVFLDDIARHGNLRMTDLDEVGIFKSLRQRGAKILNCDTDRLAILAGASELLGHNAIVDVPSEAVPDAPRWVNRVLSARQYTISGGTSEIQRNIMGERVLGLPKG